MRKSSIKVKKYLTICISILSAVLCGCSAKIEETTIPEYFEPIVQELNKAGENRIPIMNTWQEPGIAITEEYTDKVYTCEIDGQEYHFDLSELLGDAEEWHWTAAGIFEDAEDKIYICLHDYNVMYEDGRTQSPELLLIEFSTSHPENYKMEPYEVEPTNLFGWDVTCYRLGNDLYIGEETELAAIDLDTKELRYCREEEKVVSDLVEENYGEKGYYPFLFRAIWEENGVTVYSAQISEAIDMDAAATIFIAFQDEKMLSYMLVDAETNSIEKLVTEE